MAILASDIGAWHIYACLRGFGRRVYHDERDFVFHVQRYTRPGETHRYTGEIFCRTFDTETQANAACERANAGDLDHSGGTRYTHL